MRDRITLPRLLSFRLNGFQPVFQGDVTMSLNEGPHIILGGNGLGKTTLMQAVIYGLAGGLSDKIEDTKSLRWNHGYFRGRLGSSQVGTASIEISFAFGQTKLSVRRGFRGSEVIGFQLNDEGWIDNPIDANAAFLYALQQYGGYKNADDFAFLVHRLLYLTESRRLIAWDTDAQVRILMLLNQDIILEDDFRQRRDELKEMDSRKRHIHVALGKAQKQIERLMEFDEENIQDDVLENFEQDHSTHSDSILAETNIITLVDQLQQVAGRRASIHQEAQEAADDLSNVSKEIEALREQIEHAEASLVIAFLKEEEREKDLALHKLVENGICPVCGTHQAELRSLAQKHFLAHRCMLCGSEEPHETNPELTTLRSQLTEKIRAQQAFEEAYRTASNHLEHLRHEEDRLQTEVNKVRFDQPIVDLTERNLPEFTHDNLMQLKKGLELQEAELEAQIHQRKTNLDREYENFRVAINTRIVRLRQTYKLYATQFLGLPCELSEKSENGQVALTRFVPQFNEIQRDAPESCSEAQRFFLDIAFRMALIDFSSITPDSSATFFCETPETALDMSYIDNVVKMFGQFTQKGHSLLLTANIQPGGIAEKLLRLIRQNERAIHALNLLDIGQLSKVHLDSFRKLRKAVQQILGARKRAVRK